MNKRTSSKEKTGSGILVIRDRAVAVRLLEEAQRSRARIQVSPREDRTLDGVLFASKKEMERWQGLRMLERSGEISNLKRQIPYRLDVNGQHICNYIADFQYYDEYEQRMIIEDAKGFATELYKLKKRLMLAIHGITINEV